MRSTLMTIIEGGGGTDFVKWWAEENKKNGYQTISMNTTQGIGGAALWLGVSLLEGAKAPKLMIMPVATVDASNQSGGIRETARRPDHQPDVFARLGQAAPAVEVSPVRLPKSSGRFLKDGARPSRRGRLCRIPALSRRCPARRTRSNAGPIWLN